MIWWMLAHASALPPVPLLEPDWPPPVPAPPQWDEQDLARTAARLGRKRRASQVVWALQAMRLQGDLAAMKGLCTRLFTMNSDGPSRGWVGVQCWYGYAGAGPEAEAALAVALAEPTTASWAQIAQARGMVVEGQFPTALAALDGNEHPDAYRIRLQAAARMDVPDLDARLDNVLRSGHLSEEEALLVALVAARQAWRAGTDLESWGPSWVRGRGALLGDSAVAAMMLESQQRAETAPAEARQLRRATVKLLDQLLSDYPLDPELPWRVRLLALLVDEDRGFRVRASLAERLGEGSAWRTANPVSEEIRALVANELGLAARAGTARATNEDSLRAWMRAATLWEARVAWGYLADEDWQTYAVALSRSGRTKDLQELVGRLSAEGREGFASQARALLPQ